MLKMPSKAVQSCDAPLLQLRAVVSFDSAAMQYTCLCIDTGTCVSDPEEGTAISRLLEQLEAELKIVVATGRWPSVCLGNQESEREWNFAAAKFKPLAVRLHRELSTEVVFACCNSDCMTPNLLLQAA